MTWEGLHQTTKVATIRVTSNGYIVFDNAETDKRMLCRLTQKANEGGLNLRGCDA